MDVKKIKNAVRCDMELCGKLAEYSVGGDKTALKRRINLCGDCARALYGELGKLFVPKSPINVNTKRKHLEKTE
jgi:hypothetical protein